MYYPFSEIFYRSPRLSLEKLDEALKDSASFLNNIRENKDVMSAIQSVSKNLYRSLKNGENDRSVVVSCYNYLCRMATKPVPYDLFSGMGQGKPGRKNNLTINFEYNLQSRINLDYLIFLSRLHAYDSFKEKLTYFPNSTIYDFGDKIRFLETGYAKNSLSTANRIVSINSNEIIFSLIEISRNGIKYEELLDFLLSLGYKKQESVTFLDELISSQLLESNLTPCIEKGEFIEQILSKLDEIEEYDSVFHQIYNTIEQVNPTIENSFIVEQKLLSLTKNSSLPRNILSKNIVFEDNIELNRSVSEDVLDGIKVLYLFASKRKNQRLEAFKSQFSEQFEKEEVSLVKILDPETGIGYGSKNSTQTALNNFLADVDFKTGNNKERKNSLIGEIFERISNKDEVIVLNDEKYENLSKSVELDVPDTFSCAIELGKDKAGENVINLKIIGTISATILISRYTDYSKEVQLFAQKVHNTERNINKNKIIAEVCYTPENESSNIVGRKISPSYTINYLSSKSAKSQFEIDINDLMISIQNNKFVLRSKKLNSEIIPRHSNPFNYHIDSMPVFNFLCDLQEEQYGVIDLTLNTERFAYDLKFVPRVVYKNMILAPKTWGVLKNDIINIIREKKEGKSVDLLRKWQRKMKIPNEVYLVEILGDRYINFQSDVSVYAFLKAIKNKDRFLIKEFFYSDHESLITDKKGNHFTHELILSYHKKMNTNERDVLSI